MKIIKHNLKYLIFVIIWMAVIWFLSSRSVLNVGLIGWADVLFKKLAHVFVYTMLSLFLTKLFIGYKNWDSDEDKLSFVISLLLVFFLGTLYAIGDEIHQSFVPNRNPSLLDIGFDVTGLFFGLIWGLKLATNKLRTSFKVLFTR